VAEGEGRRKRKGKIGQGKNNVKRWEAMRGSGKEIGESTLKVDYFVTNFPVQWRIVSARRGIKTKPDAGIT